MLNKPEPSIEKTALALSDYSEQAYRVWQLWEHLFYEDPDRTPLLQQAPLFFNVVAESLVDDIVLSLCRLTDNDLVCGKVTFTLGNVMKRLRAEFKGPQPHGLDELDDWIADFVELSKKFRSDRNNRIGHTNFHAFVDSNQAGNGYTYGEIGRAVRLLKKIAERITLLLPEQPIGVGGMYDAPGHSPAGEEILRLLSTAKGIGV